MAASRTPHGADGLGDATTSVAEPIPQLPLEIKAEPDERGALLTVRGTDRKALLFFLSNALAMRKAFPSSSC